MTDKLSNGDSKKGFGGFGDLVSDVSKDIESATRESSDPPAPHSKTTALSTGNPQRTTAQTEAPRVNKLPVSPQPPSGSSGAKWLWGIGIVMVVLIGIGNSGKEKSTSYSPSPAYSPPSTYVPPLPEGSRYADEPPPAYSPPPTYAPAIPSSDPMGHAPNGKSWPARSGYLSGYAKLNTGGLSSLTIDNTSNDSNVYLKLFSLDDSPPAAVRHVFIKAGDKFTFSSVTAGDYDVRYRDLRTGALSKTDAFKLHEIYEDGGTRYSKTTMTLYKVRDGNMQMRNISESDF